MYKYIYYILYVRFLNVSCRNLIHFWTPRGRWIPTKCVEQYNNVIIITAWRHFENRSSAQAGQRTSRRIICDFLVKKKKILIVVVSFLMYVNCFFVNSFSSKYLLGTCFFFFFMSLFIYTLWWCCCRDQTNVFIHPSMYVSLALVALQ